MTIQKIGHRVAAGRRHVRLRAYFPILFFLVLLVGFSLLSDKFLTFDNGTIILGQAATLLVVSLGLTFVIIGGSIDLSVGSIVALSALAAAATSGPLGVFAIVPAALVGIVCGFLNGIVFAKGKVPSFVATLGAMVTYRGVVLFFTRGSPVQISGDVFLRVYAGRTFGIPNQALVALLMVAVVYVIFNSTVFGREVRAIGGGERVARLTGIRVERTKIQMFVLLGLLAGLAGLLQAARVQAATAELGTGLELDAIAAVVVGGTPLTGGVGSVQGTILGTFIIVVLADGMNMIGVDPYLQSIIKGVVLIAAVFVTIDRAKIAIMK
jgi:ribose transport system permease protein